MARRATNTVDYFPHCAKSGKTLAILEGRWGAVGYAFWFKLLEALCTHENHVIDCKDEETWEYLISRIPVDAKTGNDILELLARLGNIDRELWEKTRVVWCPAFIANIKDAYKNRRRPVPEKPFLPVEIPLSVDISTVKNGVSTGRSTQIKTKQNKANQSNETAIAAVSNPFLRRVEDGFLKRNGGQFTNWGRERKALNELLDKAKARDSEHYEGLLVSVCTQFWKLKQEDQTPKGFWRGQPFLPSALNASSIWDRVLESMRRDEGQEEALKLVEGRAR